jgi:hypothetical protein
VQPGESTVRIGAGINLHGNAGRSQLRHHSVQIHHAEINHPLPARVAKIFRVFRKGSISSGAALLLPWKIIVVIRDHIHPEMIAVPLRQRFRLARAKEEASNSRHFSHVRLPLGAVTG